MGRERKAEARLVDHADPSKEAYLDKFDFQG